MKKRLPQFTIMLLLIIFASTLTAQATDQVINLRPEEGFENVQSLCWVGNKLYILGEETIYQWQADVAEPEIVWTQEGVRNYRYRESAPESEAERILWEHAVCYLLPGSDALYALQPYSGQLYQVERQVLVPVCILPKTLLTYKQDEQTIYRELRAVTMHNNILYLLLGTDDPSDWGKTSLVSFDLLSQEVYEYSVKHVEKFQMAKEGQVILAVNESGTYAYHMFNTTTDEISPAFLTLSAEEARGGMALWQDRVLLCSAGQVTAYDADGDPMIKAYVPAANYTDSNIACSKNGMFAAASGSSIFLRNLTQPVKQTVLHVMGDLSPNDYIEFSLINPDIAVVPVAQFTADAVQQTALSAGESVDLFVVEAPGLYAHLKQKGYLSPLNASVKLLENSHTFYPCIQEVLFDEDELMGFPINMSAESWTLNQTLWERFDLGEVPITYAELLDKMRIWQEDYIDEYPEYILTDLPGNLATCIEWLAKEYILQCGSEYPDFTAKHFREAIVALLEYKSEIDANADNYNMPIIYTYYQGFGIGANDDEITRMMLMPALAPNEAQKLSGKLTLICMSSACVQKEAALRFVEYFAEHQEDPAVPYMLNPSLNTPLRADDYEIRLAALQKERLLIEEQLVLADDTEREALQNALSINAGDLESMENEWIISPESIANYRDVARNLIIPYDQPFLETDAGFDALRTVIDTACGQGLNDATLDAMLQNMNRVSHMIMLEGR